MKTADLCVLLVCVANVLVVAQLPINAGGFYDCPAPWQGFQDKCYKFELRIETIQGAREACQRDGANLLSIESQQEHEFISTYLGANIVDTRVFFTSGKRSDPTSLEYFWEHDGTPIESYQFWLNNEVRKMNGTRIAYSTLGAEWGWTLVNEVDKTGKDVPNRFICELSKTDIFKILEQERNFDYGSLETDPSKFEVGPKFLREPAHISFDPKSTETVVTVNCLATGNPEPEYKWYRTRELQRLQIDTLQDNRLTITNGKLTINKPAEVKGDNAEYDCVARNKFGEIRSSQARLTFDYLNDFPKSKRDPISVEAFSGIGIDCAPPSSSYPYLLYSWFKDAIPNFVRSELKPYTFISNNGKLYFSSVTKDDEGDYYCLVSSPFTSASTGGKASLAIPLKVLETVANEKDPTLASGFPTAFPSAPLQGENVRVECFAYGSMQSDKNELFYSWEKLGGPLPANSEIVDWGRVLLINNIQLVHSGTYRCSVRRWQGQAAQPGDVHIEVRAAPYFTIPLRNQHVDEGTDLTWSAIAEGVPGVTYKWYKNAVELKASNIPVVDRDRFVIQNNVLTIKQLNAEKDNGMYQLAATNSHGTRYSTAQLRVLSFAPNFIKYPLQPRHYATLRGNATLLCQPEAAPMGEKIWFKDNRPLATSSPQDGGHITQLPNGNLLITNIRQTDEGLYTCKVTNSLGEASSSGNLTVLPTTTITQEPEPNTVQINKTAIFQCQASFNPSLDITYDWYHNNRKIDFIKIRIIGETPYIEREDYFERGTGINRGALYIYNTQYFHQGLYRCIAMTTRESIERSARLTVIGPPFPPVGCTGFDVTARTIRLSWKMGLYAANGRPVTSYTVDGFDSKEGIWKTIKTNIKGEALTKHETVIDGLSPYSNYKFRVRAENVLGLGDPSKESDLYTTAQAPPEMAPQNLRRCVGKVGTLCVEWDPIPLSQQNGEGFGYIVKYKKSYILDEQWSTKTIMGAQVDRHVALVGDTNFFQWYDVSIVAFNNKGIGPPAKEITIRSAMALPTAKVEKLTVYQYNCTALMAEWEPVEDTIKNIKGQLTGYRIYYWPVYESRDRAIFRDLLGQRDTGLIIGLLPDTMYAIEVLVYNEAGYASESDTIYQRTLRKSPKEAPREVHVDVLGTNSIMVRWRGVSTDIDEEPLEGYLIRYYKANEDRHKSRLINAFKKTQFKVGNLERNVYYILRVFGYSRGGFGVMSSPSILFILGPNCEVREDSPESQYIYKCRGETDAAMVTMPMLYISLGVLLLHLLWNHYLRHL